jgi:hypothetical protein
MNFLKDERIRNLALRRLNIITQRNALMLALARLSCKLSSVDTEIDGIVKEYARESQGVTPEERAMLLKGMK